MWYIIIAIAILILFFFLKSYRKINSLTEDGTLLVAFTKEAMPKKFLGKEIPIEEQYKKLMQACYLFNLFLTKTQGMRGTYNFTIRENGPVYGQIIDVQLAPFINTVKQALLRKTSELPTDYRLKIEQYMKDPFSDEGKKLSEKEVSILSSDDMGSAYLKKMKADYIRNMKDMDFMFTLFK